MESLLIIRLASNLFKQRKNKRFSYAPRHLKEKDNNTQGLESQWREARKTNKRKRNIFTSLPFLALFLISVLVLLYILGRY